MEKITNAKNKNLMTPMGNKSVVDRIISRITNVIINGELLPGQKIPTETELSESMQVSRNSVREAIKVLEAMGVLIIKRPEGTFVAEGFSDKMLDPMVYGLILEGGDTKYLIELRRLLDVGVLNLAVSNANQEDIEDLHKTHNYFCKIVKNHSSIEEILNADMHFHRTLEKAVHNPLIEKISAVVERLSRNTRALATENFVKNNESDKLCKLHQSILNVLINRDKAMIDNVIDQHYEYWKDEIK